jgi:hypothetical protein
VLVLGCFQHCWESQFGQGGVLVLCWFLTVVVYRSLSQVLCEFWVDFQCCWESRFKRCVVLDLGCVFQCCCG